MSVDNNVTRVGGVVRWLLMATIPIAAFAVLWSVPPSEGLTGGASLEETLLDAGRWVGLGITAWLIITQLLYTLAVLTHIDWAVEVLRPVTLPIVRQLAAGAAGITITLSSVTAVAQVAPEPAVIVNPGGSDIELRQEATPTPILQPLVEPDVDVACTSTEPEGSYSAPLVWSVRPGDHLWRIAGEHLAIVLDRPPTRDEHRGYWVEVVEAARPIIRSGDPDLIYPGEQIPLPPMLAAGISP